jgi:ferredoxin-NADP reductase
MTTVPGPGSPALETQGGLQELLGDQPLWDGDEDGPLVCQQVQQVTHDVRTFVLRSRGGHRFRQLPGQYVTVSLEVGGATLSRCYTITSPPTRPNALSITVKRVPGGLVSNHLHELVRPGTELQVDGPFGNFSIAHHPAPKYLFLSAGSGVTPLMAMTRTIYDLGMSTDVVFVHFARTPADIIFRAELEAIAARNPGVRLLHVVEDEGTEGSWHGARGRVNPALLSATVPDAAERETFVCGPGPFMAAAQAALVERGLPATRYHEETFVFEDLARDLSPLGAHHDGASSPGSEVPGYEVTFRRSSRTITCRPDQFVLDAALEAGLTLPSSCGLGMCGTCKTTLLEGTVDMSHQGGIRQREIDNGKVLICCSRPTSPLVIDS